MNRLRRLALLIALCMLWVVLAGCAVSPDALEPTTAYTGEETATTAGAQTAESADCPVTTPTVATPPDSKDRDPLPRGEYFISADKGIWTHTDVWGGGSRKVPWVKPEGSQLTVQGRRLDGDAAPLWADISEGYAGDFQSSRIIIPSAGCWEIEARADASLLRFVVYVPPWPEPREDPSCENLDEIVRPDRVIIAGRIESSTADASGRWAWQSVRVTRNLYLYSLYREYGSVGRVVTVLQDSAREPSRAEGEEYLLVLHSWQVVCPQQTVAAVDFAQDPAGVKPLAPEQSLWSGKTLPEIGEEIVSAHRQ